MAQSSSLGSKPVEKASGLAALTALAAFSSACSDWRHSSCGFEERFPRGPHAARSFVLLDTPRGISANAALATASVTLGGVVSNDIDLVQVVRSDSPVAVDATRSAERWEASVQLTEGRNHFIVIGSDRVLGARARLEVTITRTSALSFLGTPRLEHDVVFPGGVDQPWIAIRALPALTTSIVSVNAREQGGDQVVPLRDDGVTPDGAAGDGVFTGRLQSVSTATAPGTRTFVVDVNTTAGGAPVSSAPVSVATAQPLIAAVYRDSLAAALRCGIGMAEDFFGAAMPREEVLQRAISCLEGDPQLQLRRAGRGTAQGGLWFIDANGVGFHLNLISDDCKGAGGSDSSASASGVTGSQAGSVMAGRAQGTGTEPRYSTIFAPFLARYAERGGDGSPEVRVALQNFNKAAVGGDVFLFPNQDATVSAAGAGSVRQVAHYSTHGDLAFSGPMPPDGLHFNPYAPGTTADSVPVLSTAEVVAPTLEELPYEKLDDLLSGRVVIEVLVRGAAPSGVFAHYALTPRFFAERGVLRGAIVNASSCFSAHNGNLAQAAFQAGAETVHGYQGPVSLPRARSVDLTFTERLVQLQSAEAAQGATAGEQAGNRLFGNPQATILGQ